MPIVEHLQVEWCPFLSAAATSKTWKTWIYSGILHSNSLATWPWQGTAVTLPPWRSFCFSEALFTACLKAAVVTVLREIQWRVVLSQEILDCYHPSTISYLRWKNKGRDNITENFPSLLILGALSCEAWMSHQGNCTVPCRPCLQKGLPHFGRSSCCRIFLHERKSIHHFCCQTEGMFT